VAPVVAKGATHRTLYLPRGRWYDYWSRTPVMGGQEITRYVNLSIEPHEKSANKPDRPRRFVVRLVPSNTARTVDYTGARTFVKFD
jgi:hypothetical protein